MGQKVKPIGLRVGINRTWDSRWYADRNYGELLHKDCLLYTSPSPRDAHESRMPSSA